MKKILLPALVLFALLGAARPAGAAAATVEPIETYLAPAVTAEDRLFLKRLRETAAGGAEIPQGAWPTDADFAKTSFPKQSHGVVLVLHQPKTRRIRSIATKSGDAENLRRALNAIALNPRFMLFDIADPARCRIQIDFIPEAPAKADFVQLSPNAIGEKRFELGVDGFLVRKGKERYYFLPGDAFIKSYLYMVQITKDIGKRFPGIAPADLEFRRFRTRSYVSFGDAWIPLYRGYPVQGPPESITAAKIRTAAEAGVDYLVRHQKKDGRFLYYYDAATDSYRDHEHPERDPKKDPYFNELRHTAGALILLYQYERSKDPKLAESARAAIEWSLKHTRKQTLPDGRPSAYLYYNTKSKLGGAGILLFVLSKYQAITGDARYRETAVAIKNHLIDQVTETGEFIYYNIYLDKPVTIDTNRNFFSFYYPGEAICGLAAYYNHIEKDENEKAAIRQKIRSAMNFLLVERPKQYPQHFAPLPSDSWLMMGINEMWDSEELRKDSYKKFVFDDADMMVGHMYKRNDALYPDYNGAYYYIHGDFPYADGARDEGLQAALELAVKTKDAARQKAYFAAAKDAAWASIHLVNTPESIYSVPNPDMTVGGIRFKHTRQWFRVDTIEHVASFYLKFLPFLEREDAVN